MARRAWLAILLTCVTPARDAGAGGTPLSPERATCTVAALPGLSGHFLRWQRDGARAGTQDETDRAARAEDFWRVAGSVLGEPPAGQLVLPAVDEDGRVGAPPTTEVPCDAVVKRRDRVAWEMTAAGYSAREIADVVSGHLTRAALDEALQRLMAGQPRATVARFLEARWREPDAARPAPATAPRPVRVVPRFTVPELERAIGAIAREFRVPVGLVRAVVAAESGGNPAAVSRAGAIGLMQLMPATAAALGVDPWVPIENLRGGVAYLAGLLRAYAGNTALALIAYNAGPQHADRVRAGRAVAYRETRQYLDAIAARYPLR